MDDVLRNMMAPSKSLFVPMAKANKLTVVALEKLIEFQMNALRGYVDLGLARLRAAAEVDDVESLQAFQAGQIEALGILSQKLRDDAKAFADLGRDWGTEFGKLAEETIRRPLQAAKVTGVRKTA